MLDDNAVAAALPRSKDYKLADAQGLYLFVTAKGGKSWRMKYRFGGKERRATFGRYPSVTLAAARQMRDTVRRELRDQRQKALTERRVPVDPRAAEAVRTLVDAPRKRVYFVASPEGLIKIGFSRKVAERVLALQYESDLPLTFLGSMAGDAMLEANIHQVFSADRQRGEWFRDTPRLREFIYDRIDAVDL